MRLVYTLLAVALAGASLSAQEIESKSATTVKVDDGKTIVVTGCVARTPEGGLTLTDVSGRHGAYSDYVLAGAGNENLHGIQNEVGHRVEITGKAADQGKGKVTVETKTVGTTGKTETRSEMKGDLHELPYLGVKSFRTLASVCR